MRQTQFFIDSRSGAFGSSVSQEDRTASKTHIMRKPWDCPPVDVAFSGRRSRTVRGSMLLKHLLHQQEVVSPTRKGGDET
jgi:hypothetical protein